MNPLMLPMASPPAPRNWLPPELRLISGGRHGHTSRQPAIASITVTVGFVVGGHGGAGDHYLDIADSTELMVLDFEPNPQDGTMTLVEAETFVTRIHDQTGHFPDVYSGESFINDQLGNNTSTIPVELVPVATSRAAHARHRMGLRAGTSIRILP
jgi:hypothetical protein